MIRFQLNSAGSFSLLSFQIVFMKRKISPTWDHFLGRNKMQFACLRADLQVMIYAAAVADDDDDHEMMIMIMIEP